jgi:hypothetical protein
MEKVIRIKSSSTEDIYDVVFKVENNLISINCNCPAGRVKTLCKHRLSLINGDLTDVAYQNSLALHKTIFNETDKLKITNLFKDLNQIEKEIKDLESIKKKLKKDIGLKFSNGF